MLPFSFGGVEDVEQPLSRDGDWSSQDIESRVSLRDGKVHVKIRFLTFLKVACCLFAFGILIAIAVNIIKGMFGPTVLCSSYMSPPHAKNRSVSRTMCVSHDGPTDVDLIQSTLMTGTSTNVIPFVVVGDWGRDGYCCQRDVAYELNRIGSIIKARFVINTGDSFYENGILNVTDEEVQTSWLNVYNQNYTSGLQWWGVLGNHEYRGNTEAMFQLNKMYSNFVMRDRWWSQVVERPTFTKPVRFILIDTSPMIFSYRSGEPDMHNHAGGIDDQFSRIEEQMQWLESQLAIQNETKLVIGHHPALSYMDHGDENRTFVETRVVSLLEKYRALAYFAGHDHNLQFAQPRNGSTSYFVSGAGSRLVDGPVKANASETYFYHVVHGFLACILDGDVLKVAAVDMYGKMVNYVRVP